MAPPYLLLVDGDPVRTPGLRRALEADGWAVQAAKGDELPAFIQQGWRPDLLLVDPEHGPGRFDLVHLLRQRDPQVPVLLMAATGAQKSIGLGVQGFLEPNQADGELAVSLRRFRPDRRGKLESEDLFGDLLEELEDNTPVALRVTPPNATPPTPLPIPVPAPAPVEEPPLKPPPLLQPSQLQARASQVPERLSPALPPSGPISGSQPALKKDEITLSGISGVHDPFTWNEDSIEVLTPTPSPDQLAADRIPEPEPAPPPADSE